MTEPAELFAQLTGEIEDLHGIAIAGQGGDLSTDERAFYCAQVCSGLKQLNATVRSIKTALGSTS